MSIDVAYCYCTNLTEQERFDIDKKVRQSRFELKFAIFFPFLPVPMPSIPFFPVQESSPAQIVRTVSSENPYVRNLLKISGGDLGKPSSPGARAQTQARNARKGSKGFAEAWLESPYRRSRPAAANRLAQQLQTGQAKGGNGLFGRFSARSTPDPSNPGCAGGPRSITVISSQKNPSSFGEQNTRIIEAHDGFKATMTDRSARHLTANHGHTFGINDPLPHQPTRNSTSYPQIRTRINKVNLKRLVDTVDEILKDPISEIFRNIKIRGL